MPPQRPGMDAEDLRDRLKPIIAFNTPKWMLTIGAFFLRTETELVLKSRRVVPTRALQLAHIQAFPHHQRARCTIR